MQKYCSKQKLGMRVVASSQISIGFLLLCSMHTGTVQYSSTASTVVELWYCTCTVQNLTRVRTYGENPGIRLERLISYCIQKKQLFYIDVLLSKTQRTKDNPLRAQNTHLSVVQYVHQSAFHFTKLLRRVWYILYTGSQKKAQAHLLEESFYRV